MSTPIKHFRARTFSVEAVQIVLGSTTKGDILGLCPLANIGVPVTARDGASAELSSTDLRWVQIPGVDGPLDARDRDWVVKADDEYLVIPPRRFTAWFELNDVNAQEKSQNGFAHIPARGA
ncbi:hypothetical protein [Mycobacteroides abscessus]|uniref:hypothetical protein n=1 Tax=Mycobacteroides abscessus TaxID=36809 RepID=UPI001F2B506E|nr:hypothetical protein [Mycobacteroides abscessus]